MGPKREAKQVYGKPIKRQARRLAKLPDDDDDIPFFDTASSSLQPANTMSWVPDKFNPPPTSQKAATMSVEPSSSSIEEVINFTGTSPDLARRYLKVS